jgi:hypothetical protein
MAEKCNCNMKTGSFGCSEQVAVTRGCGITAIVATCAINLIIFPTNVCRKCFKADTTQGIDTPSKIIFGEVQLLCKEDDVPLHVRTHRGKTVLK